MPKGYSLDAMANLFSPTYYTTPLGSTDLNTLNTYDSCGTYVNPLNNDATLAKNYPAAGVAGTLEIVPTATNGVIQRYRRYMNPSYFWERSYSGGVWSKWYIFGSYDAIFPVGSAMIFANGTNPNSLFPDQTWTLETRGRSLGCATSTTVGSVQGNIGSIAGSNVVTLAVGNLPLHYHDMTHTHTINHDHSNATAASNGAHTHNVTVDIRNNNNGHYGDSGYGGTAATKAYTTTSAGAHTHTVDIPTFTGNSGASSAASTGGQGSGTAFSVLNATLYLAVWIRTA